MLPRPLRVPLASVLLAFALVGTAAAAPADDLKEAQKLGFSRALMPEAGELDASIPRISVERIGRLKLLADRIGTCD